MLIFEMHFLIILESEYSQVFMGGISRIFPTDMLFNAQIILHVAADLGSCLGSRNQPPQEHGAEAAGDGVEQKMQMCTFKVLLGGRAKRVSLKGWLL